MMYRHVIRDRNPSFGLGLRFASLAQIAHVQPLPLSLSHSQMSAGANPSAGQRSYPDDVHQALRRTTSRPIGRTSSRMMYSHAVRDSDCIKGP